MARFVDHTQRRRAVSMTPSGRVISSSQRPLPATHNTHNRQTSVPPVGFAPATPAGERPQT